MNDEIIQLLSDEADVATAHVHWANNTSDLERRKFWRNTFFALVAAHEREACAKVCEKRETSYQYATDPWALEHIMEAQYCAAAIRARSNK